MTFRCVAWRMPACGGSLAGGASLLPAAEYRKEQMPEFEKIGKREEAVSGGNAKGVHNKTS